MKRSYTILYVDDDLDDLHLISEAFEKYTDHLSVIHAYNGVEGLRTLEKMHKEESLPCLVIVDINMPVMGGKQMLEKLRAKPYYHDLPVIMFSTSQSQHDKAFAEKYDADFISKPEKYNELNALVEQFVNRCRFEIKNSA
jgi:CheY-like chemotaxis protein